MAKNLDGISVKKVDITPPDGDLVAGKKTVTNAGTPEQLTASATPCLSVVIKATQTNTGIIYIGGTSAGALAAVGYDLSAGDPVIIDIDDLSKLWINSSANGEGVSYLYVTNEAQPSQP